MSVLGAVLAVLSMLEQPQAALPPRPPDAEATAVEGVIVEGRRAAAEEQRRAVAEFVGGLSEPTQRGRLARWEEGVCPGVVGLPQKHAAFLADRIAMEAHAVGLSVGQPGCRPDILILVTSQPNKAAADFRKRYPAYFAAALRRDRLEAGGDAEALKAFLNNDRPIRSWHVSKLATSDGRPVSWVTVGGARVPAAVDVVSSRLASAWRNDLSRALLIVDTTRTKGLTYEQLASYLAMAALAQLDLDGNPGRLSSILSVFADREAGRTEPGGLTQWDRAYLAGLYKAPADARNLNAQKGAIRRSLHKARTPQAAAN